MPIPTLDEVRQLVLRLSDVSLGEIDVEPLRQELTDVMSRPAPVPETEEALLALYRYPVPRLGPGGTCSMTRELAEEPHDLRRGSQLEGLDLDALRRHPETSRLARLDELVEILHAVTESDWSGIYRVRSTGPDEEGLEKEAYRGRPSRAIFPLNQAFVALSNNVDAVTRRRLVLVVDVARHLEAGRPYYECDREVQSELVLPIPGDGERILGLLDLESFRVDHYDDRRLAQAALVAGLMVRAGLLESRTGGVP